MTCSRRSSLLNRLPVTCSRLQSQLADQKTFSQALSQLQNSRQSIASAGQPSQQSAQSGQQGQQGQNGQQGQSGQNGQQGQSGQPGQGQSGQPGQGQTAGGGGGTNASSLPPSNRTGTAGNPTGQKPSGGTGQLDTSVYAPLDKQPKGSGEMTVPGQDTNQGETTSREQNDPLGGANNPSLVPYQSVYQSYLDTASQAMDQSYIPPSLKDYVKTYFDALQP